ncbi:ROK family protein [Thioclava sp. GXIMD2076]|uniref:N-acetylglucosamine kinase n=1 Tax=Thioclava kandeliae TaxID=3070818 RepID=A0ABV1SIV7_9RHOB
MTDLAAISGGIDLGGTKIEARLFGPGYQSIDSLRIPTPRGSFDSFLRALAKQIHWLEAQSGRGGKLPIGIGLPGIINGETGEAMAANIPITGVDLPAALTRTFGRALPLINDGQAFALSEAHGGAGLGAQSVLGLIMGTGIGAGHVLGGAPPYRRNIAGIEAGHLGIPAHLLARVDLPLRSCGCGKKGCFETYLSGPGLSEICRLKLGHPITPKDLGQAAEAGDPAAQSVLQIWAELMAELLLTLQITLDPDCIILGGGLSQLPDVTRHLTRAFATRRLGPMALPVLRLAAHGDSSGARGAAILAVQQAARG